MSNERPARSRATRKDRIMRTPWERMTRTKAERARDGTLYYVPVTNPKPPSVKLDRNPMPAPLQASVRASLRAPRLTDKAMLSALADAYLAGHDANAVQVMVDAEGTRRIIVAPHITRSAKRLGTPSVTVKPSASIGKREAARLDRIRTQWERENAERLRRADLGRVIKTFAG